MLLRRPLKLVLQLMQLDKAKNVLEIGVGRSQAVRLPKECRFNTDEVAVNRIGDIVLLIPKTNKWSSFMQAIDMFSDDFMQDDRDGSLEQERETL